MIGQSRSLTQLNLDNCISLDGSCFVIVVSLTRVINCMPKQALPDTINQMQTLAEISLTGCRNLKDSIQKLIASPPPNLECLKVNFHYLPKSECSVTVPCLVCGYSTHTYILTCVFSEWADCKERMKLPFRVDDDDDY